METKANYIAVGVFTIALILAAFGFVYWTAGVRDTGDSTLLRIRITGSASGIGRGSAVLFNGVKVGEVTRVYIDLNSPNTAVLDSQIDRLTPITKSTQADIGIAGLTGQASVELRGGNPNEPKLLDEAEAAGRVAEIIARPSAVTSLLENAQQIFTKADEVLTNLDGFVKDVREPLAETAKNAQKFSDALGKNSDQIDEFLASVGKLSETIDSVSGELDATLKSARDVLDAVDGEKVKTIIASAENTAKRIDEASGKIDGVMDGVTSAVDSLKSFSADAGKSLDKVDEIIAAVDPAQVKSAVENISKAGESAKSAGDSVAKLADSLGARTGDVEQIIKDTKELAAKLNQASTRVDGVMAKVDALLGSGDANGLAAEASETLKAYRKVADTLNGRIGAIADGLARFSNSGLRDVEALVRDGRRSITRIEEAITSLERNPQRIITGGSGTVRQFDGRARR